MNLLPPATGKSSSAKSSTCPRMPHKLCPSTGAQRPKITLSSRPKRSEVEGPCVFSGIHCQSVRSNMPGTSKTHASRPRKNMANVSSGKGPTSVGPLSRRRMARALTPEASFSCPATFRKPTGNASLAGARIRPCVLCHRGSSTAVPVTANSFPSGEAN